MCSGQRNAFPMILHPPIANQEWGWAAIMTDVLPIFDRQLFDIVERHAGSPGRQTVEGFFAGMQRPKNFAHNWKRVDAPMVISAKSGRLRAARAADEQVPAGLRSRGFIELRPFYWDRPGSSQYSRKMAASFYRILPLLLRSSRDYAEMNSFAATLAVFRWA